MKTQVKKAFIMRNNYQLKKLFMLLANAFIAALVMSFVYLVLYGLMFKGISQGITYQESLVLSEKKGFSQTFISITLFVEVIGCAVFMFLSSAVGTLGLKKSIPPYRDKSLDIKTNRINKTINKALLINLCAYGLVLFYFFSILVYELYFKAPVFFGIEIPLSAIALPMVIIGLFMQRKSINMERYAFSEVVEIINQVLDTECEAIPQDIKDKIKVAVNSKADKT